MQFQNLIGSDATVLVAPSLFDGRQVFDDQEQSVVLRNGLVAEAETSASVLPRVDGAKVVRFENGMIAPGLIDTHAHLTLPGDGSDYRSVLSCSTEQRHQIAELNLRTHLEAGVTTVRDLGSYIEFLDWKPSFSHHLPRVLRAGRPLTGKPGHMSFFGGGCETPEDIERVVNENIDRGADYIKIASSGGGTAGTVPHHVHVQRSFVEQIVDIAHARGVQVTAHALSQKSIEEAILSGVDGIEHIGFLEETSGESEFVLRIADLSREHGVYFGSTLSINERLIRLSRPPELQAQNDQVVRSAYYLENAKRLRDLGGHLAAASDAGWNYTYFGDFAHELYLLTQAGYSAIDVLRMATSGNAEYLRLDDRIGTLEGGKSADVVVFKGRPDKDIRDAKAILAVYREGTRSYFTPFK
jgi:imidazolonepropionase-like amidohydrolase